MIKKLGKGNFYLIAFLVSFVMMFLFSLVVEFVALSIAESRIPGFVLDFRRAIVNGLPFTDAMYGIQNVSQFFGSLLLVVLLIVFLAKTIAADFKGFRKHLGYNLLTIFLGFIVIYLVQLGLTQLYDLLKIEGTSGNQTAIEDALGSSTGILMVLSAVLLAPLSEELLFRHLLFGVVEKKLHAPVIIAVMVSALLFALMHGTDIFYFQYLALALILCGSYVLFDHNIFIPIGIHFLNNFSVLIVWIQMQNGQI